MEHCTTTTDAVSPNNDDSAGIVACSDNTDEVAHLSSDHTS